MPTRNLIKTLFILMVISVLSFAVPAFADWGMGYGHHGGWGHPMHTWHHGGCGSPGFGSGKNLTQEDVEKLEKEHANFLEATKELRAKMFQKQLEISSELAKTNPDAKRAADMQKEISALRAQWGQKHLAHFFNVRKIDADIGRGFLGDYGMMGPGMVGPGMMRPHMMGGWGHCEDGIMSPWGRGGYSMIGPGMMGPGWRRDMSPYGPGSGGPHHMGRHTGSLEEKDARQIVENYIKSTGNPNLALGQIKDAGKVFEVEIVTKEKSLVDKVLVDKSSGAMRSAY